MKILEVRDGFIKFEADNSVCLSSFVQIDGFEKCYIAQVTQLKRAGENSIAYAKILFLFDGSLQPYDKTLPAKESEIKEFTFDILNNSINAKSPVIAGETLGKGVNIVIDASSFDKKMLASIDDRKENNIIARNLVKQFNNLGKNVLIIDMLGVIDAKKITAGVDFKLPLDTASLAFMYQDCLNDATEDSKSLIIEIFKDLSEYSETVPFMPFGALKSIVDDMVDNSHVFKLFVLKNKLAKFDKLGYFAKNKQEVDRIEAILNSKCAIIDLSKLDTVFQNRYLAFLYEKLQQKSNTQVLLELSNVISKKNLKTILSSETIPTTFITHSRFKYLNDIKNLFDNFIISPSFTNNEIFGIYSSFLKAMPKESYLITGEAVNYIPLVSTLKVIDEVIPLEPEAVEEAEMPASDAEEAEEAAAEEEAAAAEAEAEAEEVTEEEVAEEELPEEESEENVVQGDDSELDAIYEEEGLPVEEPDAEEEKQEEPEIVEEAQITNEEILANIEEKSDAVITEASKGLTPPENMFTDDEDDTEEAQEESVELEESQDESQAESIESDESPAQPSDEGSKPEESQEEPSDESIKPEEIQEQPSVESIEIVQIQKNLSEGGIEPEVEKEEPANESIELEESLEQSSEEGIELEETLVEPVTINAEYETILQEQEPQEGQELVLQDTQELQEEQEEQEEAHIAEAPETVEENTENAENYVPEAQENVSEEISIDEEIEQQDAPSDEEPIEEVEVPEGFDLDVDSTQIDEIEESTEENTEELTVNDESINVIPITDDSYEFEEIVELNPDEADENDILIDMEDETEEELVENIDEQIVKDVDKVFTTRKDDDISDSDLDLIDELNSDDNSLLDEVDESDDVLEELTESEENGGILDEPQGQIELRDDGDDEILETRNSSTPIVPVYDADIPQEDLVISDPIQQGDTVTHAKYGNGVVEKMIKYGNKTLFSINFDNIGRRLLDPTLTEIKKS